MSYSNLRLAELTAGIVSWKMPIVYLPRALEPRYPSVYLLPMMGDYNESRTGFVVRDSRTGCFVCEVRKETDYMESSIYKWLLHILPFYQQDWPNEQGFTQIKEYNQLDDLMADITDGCYDHVLD